MPSNGKRGVARKTPCPSIWTPEFVEAAAAELRKRDPAIGRVIETIGRCRLTPEGNSFSLLVRIIVAQQISVTAARSVAGRLRLSLPGRRFTPSAIAALSVEEIRSAGLTTARATTLKLLAVEAASGRLRIPGLAKASDEEVLASLTALRGIGRWTVEMLFLFGHGRPDVFPDGDLGIRKAIGDLHNRPALPTPMFCREVSEVWRPYRSVASWYLWRHADRTNATLGLTRFPV